MHIFSLCIIDEPGQLPANLGARPSSHAYFIINDCMLYLFTDTQDSLFVTFLCVSLGVTKVVENEYYYRKFSK